LGALTPDEMLARVLYRDGLMLVIDKPAGLPVHRGPKGGACLEDHFDALRFGLPRPPALAHRLDRDTSGCLVLGRHRKALAHLGLLFKHGKVGKTYWAVVAEGPDADAGTIELPLGRLDQSRGWWMKPDPDGLPSATAWRVLGRGVLPSPSPALAGEDRGGGTQSKGTAVPRSPSIVCTPSQYQGGEQMSTSQHGETQQGTTSAPPEHVVTWLALMPLTGRTHQLRVHCAAMGWPIVGDAIYGTAPRFGGPALQLHAREVVVPISKNKPPVHVAAPVPPHLRDRLKACGWHGEERAGPAAQEA
jgi:tRNA pseudouridine32 synthase / 23S rRNA pseudouridine746 synthase